jgi:LacI family transcriptional regulator
MDKLKQIADQVGVSSTTVLRVLRGDNKEVWPSAIRRAEEIRSLAMQMGYLPNGSARATRRGRSNAVALLLSTIQGRSYLPSELFNEIHDTLDANGMRLVVSKLSDEQLTDRQMLPSILREWSCDGLLINYTDHIPQRMIDLLGGYSIPSIWVNSRQAADCVYYDDFGGGMAITRHLLEQGHRRIVYLDFVVHPGVDQTHYSRIDRHAGYVQAMQLAGLQAHSLEKFTGVSVAQRLEATIALLKSPDRPTAVISYDAGERLLYAASLAGLRVPQDLSIATYINKPALHGTAPVGELYIGRSLTAIRVPAEKAGNQAVEMILKKIKQPKLKLQPHVVALDLEVGDTTGPVPE